VRREACGQARKAPPSLKPQAPSRSAKPPAPIWIFEQLGAEPWGRLGSGAVELVASILILLPATAAVGALLAIGVMAGASPDPVERSPICSRPVPSASQPAWSESS